MSTNVGGAARTERDYRADTGIRVRTATETRRSFKTTEFYVLLASVAAVIIAGYWEDDSLDMSRIWTLVTVLAAAYMVSRGLAKAGSRELEDREVDVRP